MRIKLSLLLAVVLMFSACMGATPEPPKSERSFFYKETEWGMSLEQVVDAMGIPDMRTDEQEPEPVPEGALTFEMEQKGFEGGSESPGAESGDEGSEAQYIDFYYYDRPVLDGKYVADEKYLFDDNQLLWGVINEIDTGELSKDLMNKEEIIAQAKESYMDIRGILTEKYGPPAAEYTAYAEGGAYETDELLDLDRENAVVCASRWDGDDYRFIYVMYFFNDLMLDVRYIPHDKETVDAADNQEQQEQ